jgi:hypothetical protein
MMETEYVREADKVEYRKFCMHHIQVFARPLVPEVWHYTNADGLIGILKSGQIWSTQVACLNDSLEQRYFGDIVHRLVKEKRAQNRDPNLDVLLGVVDEALSQRDFSAAWHFVACFSEVEDDLSQWRGYGGGECGYAIGFRSDGVLEAIKARPACLFLPMSYDDAKHQFLAADVMRMAEQYFLAGLARGLTDVPRWAKEFAMAFAMELDIFASLIKHPKFEAEKERRIVTGLQPTDYTMLEFRQKRTLLARHLPLSLTTSVDGKMRLPLTRIYVGPGPAQQVTRISVGDLLKKFGYEGLPVQMSKVPYRVP